MKVIFEEIFKYRKVTTLLAFCEGGTVIRILDEYYLPCNAYDSSYLSSLTQVDCTYYLSYYAYPSIYAVNKKEHCKQFDVQRSYSKLAWNEKNKIYYAISPQHHNTIFILDKDFCEIDMLNICFPCSDSCIQDIYFDCKNLIIYVVTDRNIVRYNCNGDCLGVWLCAPADNEYRAVCTYKNFVFVAYENDNRSYIASYTKDGAFLEKKCLGYRYNLFSIRAVCCKNKLELVALARKDCDVLVGLEIDLNDSYTCHILPPHSVSEIEMECETDTLGLHFICLAESKTDKCCKLNTNVKRYI